MNDWEKEIKSILTEGSPTSGSIGAALLEDRREQALITFISTLIADEREKAVAEYQLKMMGKEPVCAVCNETFVRGIHRCLKNKDPNYVETRAYTAYVKSPEEKS